LGGEYHGGENAVILGFIGFLLAILALVLFQRPIREFLLSLPERKSPGSSFYAITGAALPSTLLLATLVFLCIAFGHQLAHWMASGSPQNIPVPTRLVLRACWFLSGPGLLFLPAAAIANAIVGWQFTKIRNAFWRIEWLRFGALSVSMIGFFVFWALYKPFLWLKSIVIIHS
jgi:hypothetical protein